eukprot:gene36492-45005_t
MCNNGRPVMSSYTDRLIPDDNYNDTQHRHFMDTEDEEDGSHFRAYRGVYNQEGGARGGGYGDDHQDLTGSDDTSLLPLSSLLVGATAGAALAWMNNRSVTEGAVSGAGMGLLGGMIYQDTLVDTQNQFGGMGNNNNISFNNSSSSNRSGYALPGNRLVDNKHDMRPLGHLFGTDRRRSQQEEIE